MATVEISTRMLTMLMHSIDHIRANQQFVLKTRPAAYFPPEVIQGHTAILAECEELTAKLELFGQLDELTLKLIK